MTSHTPPEGAVEAGARAIHASGDIAHVQWDDLGPASREHFRQQAVSAYVAAHEAGEIVWREEHEVARGYVKDAARALVRSPALAAEKARADEAVARASMMLTHSRFVDCGNVGCTYHAEDYHADAATWAQQYQTATQENRA